MPLVSNSPATKSPVQLRRSPRLSSPGFQSIPANQSGLASRNEVDLPDAHTSQADTYSETARRSVVTEPPCQVRELGSLSPVSEDVLHNLLSTTEAITTSPLDQVPALASVLPPNQQSHDQPSTPKRQSSPEHPSGTVAIQNVQRPPPERNSPWRSHIANLGSPSKFGFTSTLHDPNRTPARRIPIREAIAQGSVSPRKDYSSGPSTGIFGGPVFARCAQEDRTRSPVRLPRDVAHHATVVSSGMAKPTPLASPGKVRGVSEEPQFSGRNHLGRQFQRSASDSEISSPSTTRRTLAFPIRPAVAKLPGTIPEEHEVDSPTKSTQSKPPLKSALRQPSTMASSRIPRIGAKPYARPQDNEKQRSKGKEPVHKLLMTKRSIPSGTTLVSGKKVVQMLLY